VPGLERALVLIAPLAVVLTGVAVVASVLGWVDLARILTYASVLSVLSGFAWVVLIASVTALLSWSLTGWLGDVLPSLRRNQDLIERTALLVLILVAFIRWGIRTLNLFEMSGLARHSVTRIAEAHVGVGDLELSVGGLASALFVVLLTVFVARFVRFVLHRVRRIRRRVERDTGHGGDRRAQRGDWLRSPEYCEQFRVWTDSDVRATDQNRRYGADD
jgi:hypothetical protein